MVIADNQGDSRWPDQSKFYRIPGKSSWDTVFAVLDKEGLHPDDVVIGNGDTTLLTHAACNGAYEVCDRLIGWGAKTGRQEGRCRPPIIEMIRCRTSDWGAGHKKVVRLLASSINAQDSEGMTALMFAVRGAGLFGSKQGNLSIIKLLIEVGADIEIRDNRGRTALMHAVLSNDKSAAAVNEDVIAQMKNYSLEAAAMSAFLRDYQHRFEADGEMHIIRNASQNELPERSEPKPKSRRRAARGDATVGTIAAKIEVFFGIPEGSVCLVDAKRNPLRRNTSIATLRKRHEP